MDRDQYRELLGKRCGGRQLTLFYTEEVDARLRTIFSAAAGDKGLCLMAVGGYGRSDLAPFSDIDIMLFARDRSPSEKAEAFLYGLWDTDYDVGHSFRTPADCIVEAQKDIRTRTSLLEHRYIAGDKDLYRYFAEQVYPEVAYREPRKFIAEKLREVDARHRKYGDSVCMLEPNIKEGQGGLRDIHAVLWLASVTFKVRNFDELKKILSPYDLKRLTKAYDFLSKVRFCLHLISNRRNDTLSFELQKEVADMLGFKESDRFFAAERFMRYYYLKASLIHEIASQALDVCSSPYVRVPFQIMKQRVSDNFSVSKDRVVAAHDLARDTDMIIEAFSVQSKTGKRLSSQLRAEIKKNLFRITKRTQWSPRALRSFMSIITGRRVYETVREMHRCGVLGRFIPEFGALSFLVVYEPYHRYTVDEHTLQAVRRLEDLRTTRYKNLEYLSGLLNTVKDMRVLFLSLLLHDIGKRKVSKNRRWPDSMVEKGYHEDEGYREIKAVTERFNLDLEARNRVEFLVKNHTRMSSVALRRDINDPDIIAQFADEVGDAENLIALYLITYADMASVSPEFWTEWKSLLLRELYEETSGYLQGHTSKGEQVSRIMAISKAEKNSLEQFLSDMPQRYVLSTSPERLYADYALVQGIRERDFMVQVHDITGGAAEIVIGTRDRPGLFSQIVGVLSHMGMNIYRARVFTGKSGMVVDKMQISNWKDLWWNGLPQALEKNMREAILGDDAGRERWEAASSVPELSAAPAPYSTFSPFVEIDNETSAESSIVEFFARDRVGLLYNATRLLYEQGIDIISARINTESGLAHDIFSIQRKGLKIEDSRMSELLVLLWERLK